MLLWAWRTESLYNLVDVVEGNCRIKQALIKDKRYPNLYLLPSAQTRDKTAVSPEQMVKLIDELKEEFDYILSGLPCRYRTGIQKCHCSCRSCIDRNDTGGICHS